MEQPLNTFDQTTIITTVQNFFAKAKEVFEALVVESETSISDTLFIERFHEMMCHLDRAFSPAELFSNIHPDVTCRQSLEHLEQEGNALATTIIMSSVLYNRLQAVDTTNLDAIARRFIEKLLEEMNISGAGLDSEEARKDIHQLQQDITVLTQQFSRNIVAGKQHLLVSSTELDGFPEDYILAHKPNNEGMVDITTDYPDYHPFMQYAKNSLLREKLQYLFLTRAKETNQSVLQTLIEKRQRLARLLGFENWAAYVMSNKMSKHPKRVTEFLDSFQHIARPKAKSELRELQAFAATHGHTEALQSWDLPYFRTLFRNEKFGLDEADLRTYFSYTDVRAGLFQLVEELFELRFTETQDVLWHPSVRSYDVTKTNGQIMGKIYLDMFPRDGKYGHAAQFTLASGIQDTQYPESVLVCNFSDPEKHPEGVSLLSADDVKTFFHEFGHLLHTICGGQVRYVTLSGVRVEWDFVEVPSQLFETWATSFDVLSRFAKKYTTKEPITIDIVEKMRRAREWGKGLLVTQQVFQANISLQYHLDVVPDISTDEMLQKLQSTYSIIPFQVGTRFDLSFGHLTGYSATYYTYLWSMAFAKDMVSVFEQKRLLNTTITHRYRDYILAPGGTKPAETLLTEFLERPYTLTAFENWIKS